ncbi:hypothetical protein F511_27237 [Dorcoceras hygrometricum]|uniref:Uncharacterized protein n=1 Tax=Dorcoceras hygrometricum TaxID=472368 RepID=A0A2Z7DDN3_9LAMI|nr:hypothetical protein F511_27237 [Dorcoceras hygrometricum]
MRIRPPELETSICDVMYHVSLSTGCVLGKWVCLVTLAMSLFNLQDVCIVIGSLATLDLPMVVDLIGIYELKGPYCMLTTIRASPKLRFRSHNGCGPTASCIPEPLRVTQPPSIGRPLLSQNLTTAASTAPPPCRRRRDRTCSDGHVEEILFVPNSSGLLVQADEGVVFPVVDLIKEDLPPPTLKSQIPCEFGWIQAPRRQQDLSGDAMPISDSRFGVNGMKCPVGTVDSSYHGFSIGRGVDPVGNAPGGG